MDSLHHFPQLYKQYLLQTKFSIPAYDRVTEVLHPWSQTLIQRVYRFIHRCVVNSWAQPTHTII